MKIQEKTQDMQEPQEKHQDTQDMQEPQEKLKISIKRIFQRKD